MHGEDYVSLGYLFGEQSRIAYISDVSRFLPSTEHCEYLVVPSALRLILLLLMHVANLQMLTIIRINYP